MSYKEHHPQSLNAAPVNYALHDDYQPKTVNKGNKYVYFNH